ncbi:uncharacterized protein PADG_08280 [Paracoccidioides brasiliensis Pb18]|uniref:Uncharacterized protein n=1 Tax=Paracoccidioides brasiliensis (strain Pb18) TaxID=502780 RepID=C1GLN9_PARBD|nr:uncharacterized protein PADG_08280 [Paracoccidioides brasiliensis Pb18]EEH43355.1 hypothetical protein PADG_08280 [Paracoccidioides brasiliensis Pb18]ODH47494.1 hypothetical protein GX48_06408 [Paracoccidioides brasiliensis]
MSLPNIWHHRKVAETAARSCEICYKPSSSVLITPDNKASIEHANDEEEVASRKKKEELDKEIEKVKQEYEEKMNRKKLKDKEKKDGIEKEDKKAEKEKDDKNSGAETHMDDTPRVFALHKNFYQMRIDRIRKKEIARRNTECLKNPDLFPSTPKTDL